MYINGQIALNNGKERMKKVTSRETYTITKHGQSIYQTDSDDATWIWINPTGLAIRWLPIQQSSELGFSITHPHVQWMCTSGGRLHVCTSGGPLHVCNHWGTWCLHLHYNHMQHPLAHLKCYIRWSTSCSYIWWTTSGPALVVIRMQPFLVDPRLCKSPVYAGNMTRTLALR